MATEVPCYEILYSGVRAAKGLKPFGVFEIVDEGFSRGISMHGSREEARDAIAALKAQPEQARDEA